MNYLLFIGENVVISVILRCPRGLRAPQTVSDSSVREGDDSQRDEVLHRHQGDAEERKCKHVVRTKVHMQALRESFFEQCVMLHQVSVLSVGKKWRVSKLRS